MKTIEDLAAGIIGGYGSHITAYGITSRIHLRDDEELRIGSEQHHRQHQDSLRNDRPVMGSGQNRDPQKDQSADKPHPVETHQRTTDDQPSSVNAGSRSGKERRQLAERDGRQNGSKENQRAQPKAKRQVDQRMEGGSHVSLHASPAGEPLYTTGHRRMGGKEISKAGPADEGRHNKQVRSRGRSLHRQPLGIGIELL
jgi:hypothetical protein